MHSRVWLAYALIIGPALSKDPLNAVPLSLISPGNVATAPTNNSLGLLLPTTNNAIQQPSNSSYNYDLSSAANLTVTAGFTPKCEGAHFGINLDRHSCFDAFRNIPPRYEHKKWGPRRQGEYDYEPLPFRWSSGRSAIECQYTVMPSIVDESVDDGKCVVDLMAKSQDQNQDSASLLEISKAAERVMQKCVDVPNDPTMGGCVGKVGG